MNTLSLNWDEDLEEEWKNQEIEDQKDSDGKTYQSSPKFSPVTTFTPPKSPIEQLSKRSSVTPEMEDQKCNTLMTLLGHKSKETLEEID